MVATLAPWGRRLREGPATGVLPALSLLDSATATDLVRRIGAGDAEAEAELVDCCGRTLRFLTRRFARDEADAEDLYQETLMLALEKIRRREVQEPERLAGFLRALAKNLSIQRYRRKSYQAETSSDALAGEPDRDRPSPLAHFLQAERAETARQLLAELPVPRDRDVLLRYYIGEESSTRICSDLGIETDHFYRVLSRARERYRRLWSQRQGELAQTVAG